ncbi:MAG: sigma-70 family RNA polymerase sigma factor, partial [Bacteroidota bacterium]
NEELESRLHDAIGKLPERCRAVFALSRFEDLSHKEIAERLGISVKTIENQITKAMKLLRESLRDTT